MEAKVDTQILVLALESASIKTTKKMLESKLFPVCGNYVLRVYNSNIRRPDRDLPVKINNKTYTKVECHPIQLILHEVVPWGVAMMAVAQFIAGDYVEKSEKVILALRDRIKQERSILGDFWNTFTGKQFCIDLSLTNDLPFESQLKFLNAVLKAKVKLENIPQPTLKDIPDMIKAKTELRMAYDRVLQEISFRDPQGACVNAILTEKRAGYFSGDRLIEVLLSLHEHNHSELSPEFSLRSAIAIQDSIPTDVLLSWLLTEEEISRRNICGCELMKFILSLDGRLSEDQFRKLILRHWNNMSFRCLVRYLVENEDKYPDFGSKLRCKLEESPVYASVNCFFWQSKVNIEIEKLNITVEIANKIFKAAKDTAVNCYWSPELNLKQAIHVRNNCSGEVKSELKLKLYGQTPKMKFYYCVACEPYLGYMSDLDLNQFTEEMLTHEYNDYFQSIVQQIRDDPETPLDIIFKLRDWCARSTEVSKFETAVRKRMQNMRESDLISHLVDKEYSKELLQYCKDMTWSLIQAVKIFSKCLNGMSNFEKKKWLTKIPAIENDTDFELLFDSLVAAPDDLQKQVASKFTCTMLIKQECRFGFSNLLISTRSFECDLKHALQNKKDGESHLSWLNSILDSGTSIFTDPDKLNSVVDFCSDNKITTARHNLQQRYNIVKLVADSLLSDLERSLLHDQQGVLQDIYYQLNDNGDKLESQLISGYLSKMLQVVFESLLNAVRIPPGLHELCERRPELQLLSKFLVPEYAYFQKLGKGKLPSSFELHNELHNMDTCKKEFQKHLEDGSVLHSELDVIDVIIKAIPDSIEELQPLFNDLENHCTDCLANETMIEEFCNILAFIPGIDTSLILKELSTEQDHREKFDLIESWESNSKINKKDVDAVRYLCDVKNGAPELSKLILCNSYEETHELSLKNFRVISTDFKTKVQNTIEIVLGGLINNSETRWSKLIPYIDKAIENDAVPEFGKLRVNSNQQEATISQAIKLCKVREAQHIWEQFSSNLHVFQVCVEATQLDEWCDPGNTFSVTTILSKAQELGTVHLSDSFTPDVIRLLGSIYKDLILTLIHFNDQNTWDTFFRTKAAYLPAKESQVVDSFRNIRDTLIEQDKLSKLTTNESAKLSLNEFCEVHLIFSEPEMLKSLRNLHGYMSVITQEMTSGGTEKSIRAVIVDIFRLLKGDLHVQSNPRDQSVTAFAVVDGGEFPESYLRGLRSRIQIAPEDRSEHSDEHMNTNPIELDLETIAQSGRLRRKLLLQGLQACSLIAEVIQTCKELSEYGRQEQQEKIIDILQLHQYKEETEEKLQQFTNWIESMIHECPILVCLPTRQLKLLASYVDAGNFNEAIVSSITNILKYIDPSLSMETVCNQLDDQVTVVGLVTMLIKVDKLLFDSRKLEIVPTGELPRSKIFGFLLPPTGTFIIPLLSYYARIKGRLPHPAEVLICTKETTQADIETFSRRWKTGFAGLGDECLLSIVDPEMLHPSLLCDTTRSLRSVSVSCHVAIFIGYDHKEVGQRIFEGTAEDFIDFNDQWSRDLIDSGSMKTLIKSTVVVIDDGEPAGGKTYLVRYNAAVSNSSYMNHTITPYSNPDSMLSSVQGSSASVLHFNIPETHNVNGAIANFLFAYVFLGVVSTMKEVFHTPRDWCHVLEIPKPEELPLHELLNTIVPERRVRYEKPTVMEDHTVQINPLGWEVIIAIVDHFIDESENGTCNIHSVSLAENPNDDDEGLVFDTFQRTYPEDCAIEVVERLFNHLSGEEGVHYELYKIIRFLMYTSSILRGSNCMEDLYCMEESHEAISAEIQEGVMRFMKLKLILQNGFESVTQAIGDLQRSTVIIPSTISHNRSLNIIDFNDSMNGVIEVLLSQLPSGFKKNNLRSQFPEKSRSEQPKEIARTRKGILMLMEWCSSKAEIIDRILTYRCMLERIEYPTTRKNRPMEALSNSVEFQEDVILARKYLLKMCSAVGVKPTNDAIGWRDYYSTYEEFMSTLHHKHVITPELMKRIVCIHTKLSTGIPVILEGETGSGKTSSLVRYAIIQGMNYQVINIHGGITTSYLEEEIDSDTELLILDEANTTKFACIKELVCDRVLNGKSISSEMSIVCIINPDRKKTDEYKNVETAGLPSATTTEVDDRVYTVHPLPRSATTLTEVWGSPCLTTIPVAEAEGVIAGRTLFLTSKPEIDDEIVMAEVYVNSIASEIESRFSNLFATYRGQARGNCILFFRSLFVGLIKFSQSFHRKRFGGEVSVVSMREIVRCCTIIPYLLRFFEIRRDVRGVRDDDMREAAREQRSLIVISLFVNYGARLGATDRAGYSRQLLEEWGKLRRQFKVRLALNDDFLPEPVEEPFNDFKQMAKFLCEELHIDADKRIAVNQALEENVMVMFLTIYQKGVSYIVGMPGTSKSLALDALTAASNNDTFLNGKYPKIVRYDIQCSPHTTAKAVMEIATRTAEHQHLHKEIHVLVMEEISHAANGDQLALMQLHNIVDRGVYVESIDDYVKIPIVALTNYKLDAGKMNRGIVVHRGVPTADDMVQTGMQLIRNTSVKHVIEPIVKRVARIFRDTILCDPVLMSFYGMRDYFGILLMIREYLERENEARIASHLSKLAVSMNVSCHPDVVLQKQLELEIKNAVTDDTLRSQNAQYQRRGDSSIVCSVCADGIIFGEMIKKGCRDSKNDLYKRLKRELFTPVEHKKCMHEPTSGEKLAWGIIDKVSRHHLVVARPGSALPILDQLGIIQPDQTTVVFGPGKTSLQIAEALADVEEAIQSGRVCVLYNFSELWSSLFDVLNKFYPVANQARLGSESVRWVTVNDSFHLVVVHDNNDIGSLKAPFLSRLQKIELTNSACLTREGRSQVRSFIKQHEVDLPDGNSVNLLKFLIPFYTDELIESAVMNIERAGQQVSNITTELQRLVYSTTSIAWSLRFINQGIDEIEESGKYEGLKQTFKDFSHLENRLTLATLLNEPVTAPLREIICCEQQPPYWQLDGKNKLPENLQNLAGEYFFVWLEDVDARWLKNCQEGRATYIIQVPSLAEGGTQLEQLIYHFNHRSLQSNVIVFVYSMRSSGLLFYSNWNVRTIDTLQTPENVPALQLGGNIDLNNVVRCILDNNIDSQISSLSAGMSCGDAEQLPQVLYNIMVSSLWREVVLKRICDVIRIVAPYPGWLLTCISRHLSTDGSLLRVVVDYFTTILSNIAREAILLIAANNGVKFLSNNCDDVLSDIWCILFDFFATPEVLKCSCVMDYLDVSKRIDGRLDAKFPFSAEIFQMEPLGDDNSHLSEMLKNVPHCNIVDLLSDFFQKEKLKVSKNAVEVIFNFLQNTYFEGTLTVYELIQSKLFQDTSKTELTVKLVSLADLLFDVGQVFQNEIVTLKSFFEIVPIALVSSENKNSLIFSAAYAVKTLCTPEALKEIENTWNLISIAQALGCEPEDVHINTRLLNSIAKCDKTDVNDMAASLCEAKLPVEVIVGVLDVIEKFSPLICGTYLAVRQQPVTDNILMIRLLCGILRGIFTAPNWDDLQSVFMPICASLKFISDTHESLEKLWIDIVRNESCAVQLSFIIRLSKAYLSNDVTEDLKKFIVHLAVATGCALTLSTSEMLKCNSDVPKEFINMWEDCLPREIFYSEVDNTDSLSRRWYKRFIGALTINGTASRKAAAEIINGIRNQLPEKLSKFTDEFLQQVHAEDSVEPYFLVKGFSDCVQEIKRLHSIGQTWVNPPESPLVDYILASGLPSQMSVSAVLGYECNLLDDLSKLCLRIKTSTSIRCDVPTDNKLVVAMSPGPIYDSLVGLQQGGSTFVYVCSNNHIYTTGECPNIQGEHRRCADCGEVIGGESYGVPVAGNRQLGSIQTVLQAMQNDTFEQCFHFPKPVSKGYDPLLNEAVATRNLSYHEQLCLHLIAAIGIHDDPPESINKCISEINRILFPGHPDETLVVYLIHLIITKLELNHTIINLTHDTEESRINAEELYKEHIDFLSVPERLTQELAILQSDCLGGNILEDMNWPRGSYLAKPKFKKFYSEILTKHDQFNVLISAIDNADDMRSAGTKIPIFTKFLRSITEAVSSSRLTKEAASQLTVKEFCNEHVKGFQLKRAIKHQLSEFCELINTIAPRVTHHGCTPLPKVQSYSENTKLTLFLPGGDDGIFICAYYSYLAVMYNNDFVKLHTHGRESSLSDSNPKYLTESNFYSPPDDIPGFFESKKLPFFRDVNSIFESYSDLQIIRPADILRELGVCYNSPVPASLIPHDFFENNKMAYFDLTNEYEQTLEGSLDAVEIVGKLQGTDCVLYLQILKIIRSKLIRSSKKYKSDEVMSVICENENLETSFNENMISCLRISAVAELHRNLKLQNINSICVVLWQAGQPELAPCYSVATDERVDAKHLTPILLQSFLAFCMTLFVVKDMEPSVLISDLFYSVVELPLSDLEAAEATFKDLTVAHAGYLLCNDEGLQPLQSSIKSTNKFSTSLQELVKSMMDS